MEASQQVYRHAVHIRSHRLLIQQIILQLRNLRPKIIDEIYENIASELEPGPLTEPGTAKMNRAIDAHVAELLCGVGLRARANPKKPPKRRIDRAHD
jgi:hypothetical protein